MGTAIRTGAMRVAFAQAWGRLRARRNLASKRCPSMPVQMPRAWQPGDRLSPVQDNVICRPGRAAAENDTGP